MRFVEEVEVCCERTGVLEHCRSCGTNRSHDQFLMGRRLGRCCKGGVVVVHVSGGSRQIRYAVSPAAG